MSFDYSIPSISDNDNDDDNDDDDDEDEDEQQDQQNLDQEQFRSYYVSPTIHPNLSPKLYYLDTGNINIPANQSINIMDEGGDGELKAFKCATNSTLMIFEVILYGDNNTNLYLNNLTMVDLAKEGAGQTAGDIEPLPNGKCQDKTGQSESFWPFLRRYKDDTTTDYLGNSDRDIILYFSPAEPIPYRRIQINVKNTSAATINVRRIRVVGAIYELVNPAIPTTRTPEPTTPLTSLKSPNVRGTRVDSDLIPQTAKNLATAAVEGETEPEGEADVSTPEELDLSREELVTKKTAPTQSSEVPEKPKPAPFGAEDEIIEDVDVDTDQETQASEAVADEDAFFEDTEGDTTEY